MAESEELKSLLMRVKEERRMKEESGLKFNIQRIPWTEESSRLWGHKELDTTEAA